jgi:hypothetical protein
MRFVHANAGTRTGTAITAEIAEVAEVAEVAERGQRTPLHRRSAFDAIATSSEPST